MHSHSVRIPTGSFLNSNGLRLIRSEDTDAVCGWHSVSIALTLVGSLGQDISTWNTAERRLAVRSLISLDHRRGTMLAQHMLCITKSENNHRLNHVNDILPSLFIKWSSAHEENNHWQNKQPRKQHDSVPSRHTERACNTNHLLPLDVRY
jgi:hypothetical protein